MKLISIILLALVSAFVILNYFSTKMILLTKDEFEIEFKKSEIMHTMYVYQILYKKDNNIFMSKKEMTPFFYKWRENILYTNFNKLDKKMQDQINQKLKDKL